MTSSPVEAFLDPTVWAVVLISFTNALPTGGLGAFSNIILTAFERIPFRIELGHTEQKSRDLRVYKHTF